jgi:uncharacterized glyoxalase superfamily protein PhnB
MAEKVVPMIHVPDVRATVDWYRGIGFTVIDTYNDAGEGLSFAILSFGNSEVMFNQGGQPSTRHRREVDLYVYADNVDDLYQHLQNQVEVVEGPHDTFYGMREFIIRDLNRFWVTFGQQSAFALLMTGVREGNAEYVRVALDRGGLQPETLNVALDVASGGVTKNAEIAEMLEKAGAVRPVEVDAETLQSYVGNYKGEQGLDVEVTVEDGTLFAVPAGQQPLSLVAINETTFRPIAFDGVTIIFNVGSGSMMGATFKQGEAAMELKKV